MDQSLLTSLSELNNVMSYDEEHYVTIIIGHPNDRTWAKNSQKAQFDVIVQSFMTIKHDAQLGH